MDDDKLVEAVDYIIARVKRIKYLAGLDLPVQEQVAMALDALETIRALAAPRVEQETKP